MLRKAIALGCFFSFGPAALLSRHGRELAAKIPLDRLLPESDGPFAMLKGKSIFPWESNLIYPSEICHCHGHVFSAENNNGIKIPECCDVFCSLFSEPIS